jgi:hypothetical protein
MSMKALRSFALLLCLAPLCLSSGMLQAAQPQTKAAAAKSAPAKPAKKPVATKTNKAPAKAVSRNKAKPAAKVKRKAVSKAVAKPKLDLSLPLEMVNQLEPNVNTSKPTGKSRRKPLLPSMFPQTPPVDDSPFQLNGRLISNEMQLQLRNDSRHDVEGAAIDFEFRQ